MSHSLLIKRDAVAKPDGKPPWIARNERERQWMKRWVIAKLDATIAAKNRKFATAVRNFRRLPSETRHAIIKRQLAASRARLDADGGQKRRDFLINVAEHGNVDPLRTELRKIDPRYGRFVNLPPLKRGQHFKKRPPTDPMAPQYRLEEALFEKPLILKLWKKRYGKRNRRRGQITADDILAERWDLTTEEVLNGRLSRKRTARAR
jgi:hypothetical protein